MKHWILWRWPLAFFAGSFAIFMACELILPGLLSRANREDCDEAGRRLHGTPTMVQMPDGVHDVCFVKTEDGGTIPVQMR